MEKFDTFRPDEETIESWLDNFETRLICHDITTDEKRKHWCQALIGEAGRDIIRNLPARTAWAAIKRELISILGEANPKENAFEALVRYKANGKGLGEIASDILTKAHKATTDDETRASLGVKAFIAAVPEHLRLEMKKKRFATVKDALDEARFLEKALSNEEGKVLAVEATKQVDNTEDIVNSCLKKMEEKGWGPKMERPPRRRQLICWCCKKEGHGMWQCPVVDKNRSEASSPKTSPDQSF